MILPNLVIAGAPKCGTSSLFTWLTGHPDVCGSVTKEPFFLMDPDHPLLRQDCNVHDHGLGAYSRNFPDCSERDKVTVEASTHYIYQETALDVLSTLPTTPRILFVLRKPSERIFSSFSYSKNNLGTVAGDLSFAEYCRILKSGNMRELAAKTFGPTAYVLAREIQYSHYVDYLTRWRERVGPDRMRVLLFESMRARPRATMEELC